MGVIQCGSFTTDVSANATVTLGWEPQYVMLKCSSSTGNWLIYDSTRAFSQTSVESLLANTTAAGNTTDVARPFATGFSCVNSGPMTANATYIYLAIRRPNKPPTTGTEVFNAATYTGTNADNRFLSTTILADTVWLRKRNGAVFGGFLVGDRLRGNTYLATGTTAAEASAADGLDAQLVSAVEYGNAFSSNSGIYIGNDSVADINLNTTASNHIAYAFKRAVGVFDVVCYTGDGVAGRTVTHQLGVTPEMMIVKSRGTNNWIVYEASMGSGFYLLLNSTSQAAIIDMWDSTEPTANVFSVSANGNVNTSSQTYVAYLFATKVGISKCFSYTGNGSSLTIDCGFTTGARFILIKRTDSNGDWYVYDTARGINAGNEPHLSTNGTAAEVNTTDDIDSDNSGFIVNQNVTTNLNVTSATYIGLAFA